MTGMWRIALDELSGLAWFATASGWLDLFELSASRSSNATMVRGLVRRNAFYSWNKKMLRKWVNNVIKSRRCAAIIIVINW